MAKYSALDIAKLILKKSEPDLGDGITNLKLQKLLYYMQGFYIAIHNQELFNEDILAWSYGPVVREVYNEYRRFKDNVITLDKDDDVVVDDQEVLELLGEVYQAYGQYSALKLMEMTHQESPWQSVKQNEVISHSLLKEYFQTQIN